MANQRNGRVVVGRILRKRTVDVFINRPNDFKYVKSKTFKENKIGFLCTRKFRIELLEKISEFDIVSIVKILRGRIDVVEFLTLRVFVCCGVKTTAISGKNIIDKV